MYIGDHYPGGNSIAKQSYIEPGSYYIVLKHGQW